MIDRNLIRATRVASWLLAVALVAAVASVSAHRQNAVDSIDGFVARLSPPGEPPVPSRLFIPRTEAGVFYPLVIWLHGSGGAGTDNIGQITQDQYEGSHLWTRPDVQRRHPAFVLAPQARTSWFHSAAQVDLLPSMQQLLTTIDGLEAERPIDPKRIYLVGQSEGAVGAWTLLTNVPSRFAAAILVATGPAGLTRAPAARGIPIFFFEGSLDIRGFAAAQAMITAARGAGAQVEYRELPNAGHEIWMRAFQTPALPDWLFSKSKP